MEREAVYLRASWWLLTFFLIWSLRRVLRGPHQSGLVCLGFKDSVMPWGIVYCTTLRSGDGKSLGSAEEAQKRII